jgi:hypothetical protein
MEALLRYVMMRNLVENGACSRVSGLIRLDANSLMMGIPEQILLWFVLFASL